jgi:hypothetical protein
VRHGRLVATGMVAAAAMAIGPARAAAAAPPLVDDTAADFAAGTADASTWTVEPGSLRLKRSTLSENFDGSALPGELAVTAWQSGGQAIVAGGSLTVLGARVTDVSPSPTYAAQSLEFRATFGGDGFQNVGFGNTFEDAPWAMFSTGNAPGDPSLPEGLYARTLALPLGTGTPSNTAISGVDPRQPHTYRIDWSPTDVSFYVDDRPAAVATSGDDIAGPMRAIVSDLLVGGDLVGVDWLAMGPLLSTGDFVSRVHDAGDSRVRWDSLNAAVVGSDPVIETRSGRTPTPGDGTWSAFERLGANGAINSPSARYIQYRTSLSPANPSLDRVQISYDVDSTGPAATIDGARVSGTSATVSFSSPATDLARYECNLDGRAGGAFAPCTSPMRLRGLARGLHMFSVRGVDGFGNVGATAARRFRVASSRRSDKTAPKVSVVARSLRASRKGTVSFRIRCPANERRCRVTLQLKRKGKSAARKTVTIAGGKTATVTLQLSRAVRRRLSSQGKLKVSAVTTAIDAASNRRVTTRTMTLRAPAV